MNKSDFVRVSSEIDDNNFAVTDNELNGYSQFVDIEKIIFSTFSHPALCSLNNHEP